MTLAGKIAEQIAALPEAERFGAIVGIFKAASKSPSLRGDVFWTLDNEPGHWDHLKGWHGVLRQVRNTPSEGTKLFALFS
jgi:hypothetical protein